MIALDAKPQRPAGLARTPGDFMRDARGIPWVANADGETIKDGSRPKWEQYGRPSSLGKDIENTYNLDRHNERQIVFGMLVEDGDLTNRLLRLAELDQTSSEAKEAADGIVALTKRLAKANLAADRGTHMHAVTEDDDQEADWVRRSEHGEVLGVPVHVQAAMLEAWRLMCVSADLEMLAVEQRVVHDGWRQAGTLDRIVRLGRDVSFANGITLPAGTVLLLDVKTGKLDVTPSGVVNYWHSYAVQCAVYANATPYDCATDTRSEWEWPIDLKWAVIAHLPVGEALAGTAVCRLVLVDIEAGEWAVREVIQRARQWQARKDLFAFTVEPHVEVPVGEWEDESDPFEGLPSAERERSVRHVFSVEPIALERPRVPEEGDAMSDAQVAEIRKRAGELHQQAKAVLDALAKEANAAGHPFSIGAGPTLRRWHIYRALLRLAAHWGADLEADFIRATLALVLPEVAQPGIPLGPAIGSLTLDEAMRFVQAAIQVIAQDAVLTIDDAGQPKWLGVGNPAA
jgi:hypothetical protein